MFIVKAARSGTIDHVKQAKCETKLWNLDLIDFNFEN